MTADRIFDTLASPSESSGWKFTLDDTGGCSCEQIVDKLGLGEKKFGCSPGTMENWVERVLSR
ncbi:MAG: hypothetical protein ACXWLM_02475 [Myxococcales bacterium]